MSTQQTERWYAFRAYNSQTLYGWGTAAEAARYVDAINVGKEINLYGIDELSAEQIEDLGLEKRDDVFSLEDELRGSRREH
ncbi:hypothetical protein [Azospirillum sp. sgz302134]